MMVIPSALPGQYITNSESNLEKIHKVRVRLSPYILFSIQDVEQISSIFLCFVGLGFFVFEVCLPLKSVTTCLILKIIVSINMQI